MKWFLTWLRRGGQSKPLLAVPVAPEWSHEDAANWNQFLRSQTGQSLWLRARAMEAATCVNACAGKHEPKMAGGISFTLNWLEQMANAEAISRASLVKDANSETANSEPQTLDPELTYA